MLLSGKKRNSCVWKCVFCVSVYVCVCEREREKYGFLIINVRPYLCNLSHYQLQCQLLLAGHHVLSVFAKLLETPISFVRSYPF
jgi:hypothetical protein